MDAYLCGVPMPGPEPELPVAELTDEDITAMASLGLPGLAGFWGEFGALLSAFNPLEGLSTGLFRTLMVIGVTVIAL